MTDHQQLMAWVEARATRDECGCLLWKLAGAHGGSEPQGRYMGNIIRVRRFIYEAKRGVTVPVGKTIKCLHGEQKCVEPSHMKAYRRVGKKGQKVTVATKVKMARHWRESGRLKVADEAVADIRSGSEPRKVYAQRYGIAEEYVSDLRGGRARLDHSGPFAGLGARA
jgi:hypothetical protein